MGRVWKGVSPSTVGTFLDFGVSVLKPGFWLVIKFKSTSIIPANVCYDCSMGGGGVSVVK